MLSDNGYESMVHENFKGSFMGGQVVQEGFHIPCQVNHKILDHISHFGWLDEMFLHQI
jgi:hypothetical protein